MREVSYFFDWLRIVLYHMKWNEMKWKDEKRQDKKKKKKDFKRF